MRILLATQHRTAKKNRKIEIIVYFWSNRVNYYGSMREKGCY